MGDLQAVISIVRKDFYFLIPMPVARVKERIRQPTGCSIG